MAINKITSKSVKDLELSADDLAPGSITSAKLATGTISTTNIAPGTIANDRLANNSITINGTSIALGASGEIVAGTDWQAVTVADGSTLVNATAGQGLLLDTNAGVIEVVLPGSPSRGDTIKIVDYGGTFATNNCLVNLNGSFLDSTSLGFFNLSTNDTIAEFVYIDANKGWLFYQNSTQASTPSSALVNGQLGVTPSYTAATGGTITESGDYKIHTFTGDGCFVVSVAGNNASFACTPLAPQAGPDQIDYLVIAGGGGGGGAIGGGGGAGGYRESYNPCTSGSYSASPLATPTSLTISGTTYPVTVGGGGTGSVPEDATPGSNSVFSTITSAGGGSFQPCATKKSGGSGSGGGHQSSGGAGNTPPVSPPQGNNGGSNGPGPINAGQFAGGGGGGAGGTGTPSSANGYPSNAGPGGAGTTSSINGSPVTRAGGGGGGAFLSNSPGSGGSGGGGAGAGVGPNSVAGTANTGGGGGGGAQPPGNPPGANGGSGVVIIRYKFQ